jgi:hypothetical protein
MASDIGQPKNELYIWNHFAGFEEMLSQQFDTNDGWCNCWCNSFRQSNFRNVCPQPVEDYIKQLQEMLDFKKLRKWKLM